MSRISKRKLLKVLKGELEVPAMSKSQIFDMFKNPPTQEEWLKGYHKWVQDNTLSTPLSEYEAIENIAAKELRRTGKNRKKRNDHTRKENEHKC